MIMSKGNARESVKDLIKRRIAERRADVNIGKGGVHEGLVGEVKRLLEQHGVIKVRVLKSARKTVNESAVRELAERLDAVVVDARGFTYVLASRKLLRGRTRRGRGQVGGRLEVGNGKGRTS